METCIKKIYYIAQDPKTFMVVAINDDVELEDYCMEMVRRNDVKALLPMHSRVVNGATELLFDITGKSRLFDTLQGVKDGRAVKQILRSCCAAMEELYEYFLHPSQCILDKDNIFVTPKQEIKLALVPRVGAETECGDMLQKLFLDVVGACPGASDAECAVILSYLIKNGFSLQEFAKIIRKDGNAPAKVPAEPKQSTDTRPPVVQPAPIPDAPPSPVIQTPSGALSAPKDAKAQINPTPASSANNLQIPGFPGIPPAAQKKEKPVKENKEKSHKKDKKPKISLFSFGKKKEASLHINEEAHKVVGGIPAKEQDSPAAAPKADPAPAPAVDPHETGEVWQGTVIQPEADETGATQFSGSDEIESSGLSLIHDGLRIAVNQLPFTVGRENCSYVIDRPKVSRRHFVIRQENGEYTLTAENSTNHTMIDGAVLAPYTPCCLKDGMRITAGDTVLQVSLK